MFVNVNNGQSNSPNCARKCNYYVVNWTHFLSPWNQSNQFKPKQNKIQFNSRVCENKTLTLKNGDRMNQYNWPLWLNWGMNEWWWWWWLHTMIIMYELWYDEWNDKADGFWMLDCALAGSVTRASIRRMNCCIKSINQFLCLGIAH